MPDAPWIIVSFDDGRKIRCGRCAQTIPIVSAERVADLIERVRLFLNRHAFCTDSNATTHRPDTPGTLSSDATATPPARA